MKPADDVVLPKDMPKADRRVIFVKLEEVYVDEKIGYGKGWDDQRVAADLGVPLAWVAYVRDENFGPNRSEDNTQLIKDGRELLAEMRGIQLAVERHAGHVREALAKMEPYKLRLDKIEKQLQQLERRG